MHHRCLAEELYASIFQTPISLECQNCLDATSGTLTSKIPTSKTTDANPLFSRGSHPVNLDYGDAPSPEPQHNSINFIPLSLLPRGPDINIHASSSILQWLI
jgi:hypothetical protein